MIQFDKLKDFIKKKQWQSISNYLQEIINNEKNQQNQQKKWLIDYVQQKKEVIQLIRLTLFQQIQEQNKQFQYVFQEIIIKIFVKGLIIPELNFEKDIDLLSKMIEGSTNNKYLLVIFQQALIQIKDLYQMVFPQEFNKIYLKFLKLSKSFLILVGQNVFEDILNKYQQFFGLISKFQDEEKVANQKDNQIIQFNLCFVKQTMQKLKSIVFNENSKISLLKTKIKPRQLFFQFLKLLITHNSTQSDSILNILTEIINKLQIPLQQLQNLPSIWLTSNIQSLKSIYNQNTILYILGINLINQLPSKPEYFKIPNQLFPLISQSCKIIYLSIQPINKFALKLSHDFYLLLFEKFAILMGLLNKNKQNQKQIQIMINLIFKKKKLFVSNILIEDIWRRMVNKHDDHNFRIFCLNQYKKVFYFDNQQYKHIQILNNSTKFLINLVNQLEANSDPQKIGFYITISILYQAYLKKVDAFYSKFPESKTYAVFNFFYNNNKKSQIRNQLKGKFTKLKQSLKDRLQVAKMKQQTNQKNLKDNNQISICIYRIEQQMIF